MCVAEHSPALRGEVADTAAERRWSICPAVAAERGCSSPVREIAERVVQTGELPSR